MKINKQLLLSVGAIFGMCCAVGTAIYVTPKAKELADKYKDDKFEAAKRVAPLYIPATISFLSTCGCIVAKDYISRKELLALSASTAATTSYLVANRDKLKQITENSRVKNLAEKLMPSKEELKHQTIEETGLGDVLCIEGYSGRLFRSSPDAVVEAQKKLAQQYIDECYCSMNDYYRYLGIQQSQFGHEYGWANDEDWFYRNEPISFTNELVPADAPGNEFNEPIFCMDIDTDWYPMQSWQEI